MSDKSNILASLLGGVSRPSSRLGTTNGSAGEIRPTSEKETSRPGSSRATSGGGGGGKQHKLRQRFNVIRKLGKGAYGKVQLAINKETGQEVAIKTIKKTKIENELDMERVRREIQIMSSIEHPHIVHIYEVFENKDKIVLVMQYAPGGELYEYVSDAKVLDEAEARRLFRQIATAIYYCHKNKICHRDLKLENILLDEKNNAKLADFGLSNVFDKRRQLKTFCGSPLYASPEIVQGSPYEGPEVDCWSLGVLLYTLVYGAMPFDGSNFKRLVKQISESSYFEPKQKSHASPLIKRLLCADPNKRATIVDICSDPWVNGMVGLEQQHNPLLQVAQDMANLTPVRMDILMALATETVPLAPPEEKQPEASGHRMAAKPPLARIENKPESKLEQEDTVPIATFVLRDLEPIQANKEEEQENLAPPIETEAEQDKRVIEASSVLEDNKELLVQVQKMNEERPGMEIIECGPNQLDKEISSMDVKPGELEEIPMELDTVVCQNISSPIAVTMDTLRNDQKEEPEEEGEGNEAIAVPMNETETEEKLPVSNEVAVERDVFKGQPQVEEDKTKQDKAIDGEKITVTDEKQAETDRQEDKADEKPKKPKKKVLVKRKKKVSKKEKEPANEEQKSATVPVSANTDTTSTKPGKIQIPDTFTTSTPDPSETLPPRGIEGRRQSALIADVAQKLFQPNNQQPVKHEDDLHELANVRVSDKKSEFERRASSSTGAPIQSPGSLEHRRRSSLSRQEPQLGKAELLREPSNEVRTSLVELAPLRVPFKVEDLASGNSRVSASNNLQDHRLEVLNDSQETIKLEEARCKPVQVQSHLSIKLGEGGEGDYSRQSTSTRQPTPTMVPITRSYKKVTFTKDGACVTETGKVISTELPDGTIRRVDRRSKVTHYVGPANQKLGKVNDSFNSVNSPKLEVDQLIEEPDWDSFHRLVMPSSNLQLHHTMDDNNRHNKLQPNESCSSLSSGSTDAFEDIFDTWTGAFQHGFPSTLSRRLGATRLGGRNGRNHANGPRSEAASPRCGSADPTRSCWGTPGAPVRPPVWPSSAGSGYESDAGSRGTTTHRFGGSLLNGVGSGLRSSGTSLLSSKVEDLHLSIAEEHERLRQRIARQHRNFWKGSTPSLFSVSEKEPAISAQQAETTTTTTSSVRMSPANRPPRPNSGVQQKQQVIRTTSVKTKSPNAIHQEHIEQSLSSTSFIQQSVALDPAPRRQPLVKPTSDSISSLIKSSSRTSVQSSGASFIGLKKSTSIRQKLQQQHEVQHHQQMNQQDETARVQNWLQHSTGAPGVLSSDSSGSSFGVSTNNSTAQRNCIPPPAAESTKTSGSMSSVSRAESSSRVHRTIHIKSSATEAPTEFVTLERQTSRKSPLEWMQSSVLEENEEAETTDELDIIAGTPLRTGSLLDQLRSRGYRSMINQRMESQEEIVPTGGSKHLFAATSKTSTSSTTTSFITESGASTTQQQQHFVTTTSSSTNQQKTLKDDASPVLREETAIERLPQDINESKQTPDAVPQSAENESASCSLLTGNNLCESNSIEPQSGSKQKDMSLNGQPDLDVVEQVEVDQAPVLVQGEGNDDEDEDDDDEDIRQGKEAVKAQLQRMRETELFLKSLQKEEEQEQVRKQSFLFDNMILNARLSSELARASVLSNSSINLRSAGSSISDGINMGPDTKPSGASTQSWIPKPQQVSYTTSNPIHYSTTPSSAPVLMPDLYPASPFMSSFSASASSTTHTAPILASYRRPLWNSISNPPMPASDEGASFSTTPRRPLINSEIPEFRRSRSQLGAELPLSENRPSRASFRDLNPPLDTNNYNEPIYQPRSRFRSQSQVRQLPSTSTTSTLRHYTPGVERWRRELSVNPPARATSPFENPTLRDLKTRDIPEPSNSDDDDTLHPDDVERFGFAKFRVSAYEPTIRPARQADRRRSLQASSTRSKFANSPDRGVKLEGNTTEAPNSTPEVGRRYSTVSECGESTGQSRLQELEQRILANKKRRDELLASNGSSAPEPEKLRASDRLSMQRAVSPGRHSSPSTAPAGTSAFTRYGSNRRSSSRLPAAEDQLGVGSSSSTRPSRLESMEARIKRRSYCVRLADCSPERSRPPSLSLEGWKRGTPMQWASKSLQSQTAAPDRLDAKVSALNDQLDDKLCRRLREANSEPAD